MSFVLLTGNHGKNNLAGFSNQQRFNINKFKYCNEIINVGITTWYDIPPMKNWYFDNGDVYFFGDRFYSSNIFFSIYYNGQWIKI